jgi:hypothetical protein
LYEVTGTEMGEIGVVTEMVDMIAIEKGIATAEIKSEGVPERRIVMTETVMMIGETRIGTAIDHSEALSVTGREGKMRRGLTKTESEGLVLRMCHGYRHLFLST